MSLFHTQLKGFRMSNKIDHIAVPIYRSDNQGRDTYIGNSNGGNTVLYQPEAKGFSYGADPNNKLKTSLKNSLFKSRQSSIYPSFSVSNKYINYFSNG